MIHRVVLALGLVFGVGALLVATLVAAQEAPEVEAEAAPDESAEAAEIAYEEIDEILEGDEEILGGGGYSYDPAGRRDPFRSLRVRNTDEAAGERPEGVPGLLIDEIELSGIFDLDGRAFAQVQVGSQDKAFLIQQGDLLYDGEVIRVGRNEVVFKQKINDPSIIKPFREVVKKLNPEP